MSEALLESLNPGANFGAAGTAILVVQAGNGEIGDGVARVEVDKSENQLRLLDGAGVVIAAFPATVGSTERPAPDGTWAVKFVTFNPDYTYDPKRLTFGKKSEGALTIAPGPNNPVGSTWIELTKPTFGIHGSPDPDLVGKTASHGCVRLTNWDATAVGHALKKDTPVVFVGETSKA
jgi:lipoprotein-anchoring transpeptidase ErfK/SrfK